jgi:hypothetical protein
LIPKLFKELGSKREKLAITLNLISTLLKNICEKPDEVKFRTIRKVKYSNLNLRI